MIMKMDEEAVKILKRWKSQERREKEEKKLTIRAKKDPKFAEEVKKMDLRNRGE